MGIYGESITKTLLNLKDMVSTDLENEEKKTQFHLMLDEVIDAGVAFSDLVEIVDVPHAVHYFSGYIARKAITFTKRHACIQTLVSNKDENENTNSLIAIRDKFCALIYPSAALAQMATIVENVALNTISSGFVANTPLRILDNLSSEELPILGCNSNNHDTLLSRRILQFFITVRLHFILEDINKE